MAQKKADKKTQAIVIVLGGLFLLGGVAFFQTMAKNAAGQLNGGGGEGSPGSSGSEGSGFTGGSASMGSATLSDAFSKMKALYGKDFAARLEQMYRLETDNFKSGQWLKCTTPGMVAVPGTTSFPWGWTSLKQYADVNNLKASDFGTVYFGKTSDGKPRTYIKFPNLYHNINFTGWFLHSVRGGNIPAWYSTNAAQQAQYAQKMKNYSVKYVT